MLGCILVLFTSFSLDILIQLLHALYVRIWLVMDPQFFVSYASKIYGQAFHEHALGKVCSGDVAIIKSKGGRGITSP